MQGYLIHIIHMDWQTEARNSISLMYVLTINVLPKSHWIEFYGQCFFFESRLFRTSMNFGKPFNSKKNQRPQNLRSCFVLGNQFVRPFQGCCSCFSVGNDSLSVDRAAVGLVSFVDGSLSTEVRGAEGIETVADVAGGEIETLESTFGISKGNRLELALLPGLGCLDMTDLGGPWEYLWWFLRCDNWVKPLPQSEQLNGFSPVWIRACLCSLEGVGNLLPQYVHSCLLTDGGLMTAIPPSWWSSPPAPRPLPTPPDIFTSKGFST